MADFGGPVRKGLILKLYSTVGTSSTCKPYGECQGPPAGDKADAYSPVIVRVLSYCRHYCTAKIITGIPTVQ